jgi:hypothetical protein
MYGRIPVTGGVLTLDRCCIVSDKYCTLVLLTSSLNN